MKKQLLILLIPAFTLLFQQRAFAQFFNDFTNDGSISAQLTAGTQGFGADVRYGINDKWSARLGASFLPITVNNAFIVSGFRSTANASARFSNIHFLADYVPFEDKEWIRLVAGGGYLYKANGNINLVARGNYRYGQIIVSPSDVGTMDVNVSWKGFAPYLGVGLFRGFPMRVVSLNLDFGTYYLASPHTTVVGTKYLSANGAQQEAQVTQNVKNDRFLPVLQLNLNFKIK